MYTTMLTLYYKPSCPYCQRVIDEVEEMGLKLDLKDVTSAEAILDELIEKGGKRQVPYLVDSGKDTAMYESGDIIDYLKEHYVEGNQENTFNGLKVHATDKVCESCE